MAIVNRDAEFGTKIKGNKGGCQYPLPHKCDGDKGVQVHHVRPVGYCDKLDVDPNYAYNGLSICKIAHVSEDGVHPDTAEALKKYRGNGVKGDRDAFKRMSDVRKEKLAERVIYWDPKADRPMDMLAIRNTQKAENSGKWHWPFSNRKK